MDNKEPFALRGYKHLAHRFRNRRTVYFRQRYSRFTRHYGAQYDTNAECMYKNAAVKVQRYSGVTGAVNVLHLLVAM